MRGCWLCCWPVGSKLDQENGDQSSDFRAGANGRCSSARWLARLAGRSLPIADEGRQQPLLGWPSTSDWLPAGLVRLSDEAGIEPAIKGLALTWPLSARLSGLGSAELQPGCGGLWGQSLWLL